MVSDAGTRPAGRSPWRRFSAVWAFVAYTVIAVALTFPLILHLRTVIVAGVSDSVLTSWILWWNGQVLPFTERWWSAPMFYPATDVMAYSEHLVGLSFLAIPISWLTASPVATYNLVLLLTFPLSAVAGYLLGHELTGRRDAGWIVGLAFGFAPYRADQLTHIQVLASFWMPLVLLGLHRYLRRGRRRWLVLFGLSLLMQGLCNLYYMLYVPVLVGLWGLWFIVDPRVGWRRVGSRVGAVVAVAALAHLPVLPVLHHYSEVHESLGFSRSVVQAEHFSADLTDLLSASKNLTAWGFEHRFRKATGMKLFPGLTILLLIVVAAVRLPRPDKQRSPGWLSRVHLVLGVLGVAGCLALAARLALGPWEVELLGLELSVSRLSRAVTLTVAVWTLFALSGPALLGAWRRKSVPLFYLLAAALLWVLALGPKPTLMGEPILTTAPFRWLMLLPGFDGVRVPARFWMLAVLCLSALAGVLFARLVSPSGRWRRVLLALVSIGILADGWMFAMPTFPAPRHSRLLDENATGPVLELPLGGQRQDLAAAYRSSGHGQPVVNGRSGYRTPHYRALQQGLRWRDPEVLRLLAGLGVRHVLIKGGDGRRQRWERYVGGYEGAQRLGEEGDQVLYNLEPAPPFPVSESFGGELRLAAVSSDSNPEAVAFVDDGDSGTVWMAGSQREPHQLTVDLGVEVRLGAVVLELGPHRSHYPLQLVIELSADGEQWREAWHGTTFAYTVSAAIHDLEAMPLVFPLGAEVARFIRLRQLSYEMLTPWSVSELRVFAP